MNWKWFPWKWIGIARIALSWMCWNSSLRSSFFSPLFLKIKLMSSRWMLEEEVEVEEAEEAEKHPLFHGRPPPCRSIIAAIGNRSTGQSSTMTICSFSSSDFSGQKICHATSRSGSIRSSRSSSITPIRRFHPHPGREWKPRWDPSLQFQLHSFNYDFSIFSFLGLLLLLLLLLPPLLILFEWFRLNYPLMGENPARFAPEQVEESRQMARMAPLQELEEKKAPVRISNKLQKNKGEIKIRKEKQSNNKR